MESAAKAVCVVKKKDMFTNVEKFSVYICIMSGVGRLWYIFLFDRARRFPSKPLNEPLTNLQTQTPVAAL